MTPLTATSTGGVGASGVACSARSGSISGARGRIGSARAIWTPCANGAEPIGRTTMPPNPTPARTVGDQRPPWDLQTMHEIQAMVFAHFGDEIVPEYISAQLDDFIAFCLVHGGSDAI